VSANEPILELRDVHIRRGDRPVLMIPAMRIYHGEILSLIGPNGAGKTTLMHAFMRLIRTDNGEIYFLGEKVPADGPLHTYRRNFAMVLQEPMLFSTTVYKNIASGLKIRGMSGKEIEPVVREQMERFGITHLQNRDARELSGGEGQRANLARAFAVSPKMLLLDEPFASLDPPTRESLIDDLSEAIRRTSTTTVFATHDRSEAIRLSNRIAVMNEGRILQIDSAEVIMQRPADEFVASFVGTETILTGDVIGPCEGTFMAGVSGKEIEIMGAAARGERVTFGIRPENIVIAVDFHGKTSARNTFDGIISRIVPMGVYYKIHIDCGFPLIAYVTGHSMESLALSEGKEVIASFKATSIHIIRKEYIRK